MLESNESVSCLDPRGLPVLLQKTANSRVAGILTGSLAAARFAPSAPARLALVYVDEPDRAMKEWGLEPTETGANVNLLRPYDRVVFERVELDAAGLRYAAPAQVAVDLLTGPGRGPSEAEAELKWLEDSLDAKRI